MEVKGLAIKTTRDFVKINFPNGYEKWIGELPQTVKEVYKGSIDVGKWFPIKEIYLEPVGLIARLFYGGDLKKCGNAIGYYSADIALKGVYKVFLLVATPKYLVQKASGIITTYYRPSEAEAYPISPKSVGIRITEFSEIDEALEYRLGGWSKRALELANCKGVKYEIVKSRAKGDIATEIVFTWE